MAKRKVITSSVEVYKVVGESMQIAFNNFKNEYGLDSYNLEPETNITLAKESISNGAIFKNSKVLYNQYINNLISEYTIRGCLYNYKPILKDSSRVVMHNIVSKGTKVWETVNSYRTDSNEVIEEDTSTKAEALVKANELAIEKNKTINVVVSKRLVGMDGILGIAEWIPVECVDDTNVYVFWKFNTDIKEIEEEDLINEHTEEDEIRQLSIKENLFGFIGRKIIE